MTSPAPLTRVLFVAANPDRDISTEEEFKHIRAVLHQIPGVEVQAVFCATIDDLQNELIDRDYEIVHLAAHGTSKHAMLEDPEDLWGGAVPAGMVVDLLRHHDALRCVVLNACHSASWITEPLGPALVLMNGPIGDAAALHFSEGFYRCVAAGRTLPAAFEQGSLRARRNAPSAEFNPSFMPDCFGVIGVRTHRHFQEDIDRRCQYFCDLEPHFPASRDPDWDGAQAKLGQFSERRDLRERLSARDFEINLDCPSSIALMAGRLFGAHANIYPLQSRPARELWKPNNELPMPVESPWRLDERSGIGARKLVVSLSVTRDIRTQVGAHLATIGAPVHWVDFTPIEGAHPHVVRGSDHANALARTLGQELPRLRAKYDCDEIELFFAVPNAFMFLLGQQGGALGTLNLHEKVHGNDRYVASFCSR